MFVSRGDVRIWIHIDAQCGRTGSGTKHSLARQQHRLHQHQGSTDPVTGFFSMDTERRLFQHGANLLLCFLFGFFCTRLGFWNFDTPLHSEGIACDGWIRRNYFLYPFFHFVSHFSKIPQSCIAFYILFASHRSLPVTIITTHYCTD